MLHFTMCLFGLRFFRLTLPNNFLFSNETTCLKGLGKNVRNARLGLQRKRYRHIRSPMIYWCDRPCIWTTFCLCQEHENVLLISFHLQEVSYSNKCHFIGCLKEGQQGFCFLLSLLCYQNTVLTIALQLNFLAFYIKTSYFPLTFRYITLFV